MCIKLDSSLCVLHRGFFFLFMFFFTDYILLIKATTGWKTAEQKFVWKRTTPPPAGHVVVLQGEPL